MSATPFHSIDDAVADLKAGRIIIVVDDEDRENEGDFVAAAESITPETVNFFVTHGRGILCASITAERAEQLKLDPMVENNTSLHETPFTVPVDYLHGTTTGVSSSDRSATIKALTDPAVRASDFGRPGHIFPLRADAREFGILRFQFDAGLDDFLLQGGVNLLQAGGRLLKSIERLF